MLLARIPATRLAQAPTITTPRGDGPRRQRRHPTENTIVIAGCARGIDPASPPATNDRAGLNVMHGGIDTHVHPRAPFDANGQGRTTTGRRPSRGGTRPCFLHGENA